MESVLEVRGLTKRFPGLVANDAITFDARKGEVHALVGENGAGKSTLMKMITGLYQPDEGEMFLRGEPLLIQGPRDAIQKGIGMVHQHFMLINRFDVVQNIILGYEKSRGGVIDFSAAKEEIQALCQLYDFKVGLDVPVGSLSVGCQQRVEILKVLYRGAEILILDEPTAVLTPQEVKELFVNLRRLKDEGKTILFISHKLGEVLEISDRITVLRRGKVMGTVKAAGTTKKDLAEMMVGRPVLFCLEKPEQQAGIPVLEVKQLSVAGDAHRHPLRELSLSVRSGEIYGIAGVEGNGQRELVETIMGLNSWQAGEISIKGNDTAGMDVAKIREIGVGYIPEDRHHRAVVLPMSVWENCVLGLVRKSQYSTVWKMAIEKIRAFARQKVDEYDVRLGSIELAMGNLSGGNQQKVVLARELSYDPDLLIAAQPVRGLDIGAIEFVQKKLIEARGKGKAVLMISADLEEVLSVADRVGIMYNGQIVKEFVPGELELEEIGQYMLGAANTGEDHHE